MILVGIGVAVGTLLATMVGVTMYFRWFTKRAFDSLPYAHVHAFHSTAPGVTKIRLTLRGTGQSFELVRVTADTAMIGRFAVPLLAGFEPDTDHDLDADVTAWRPSKPFVVRPGRPVLFEVMYDQTTHGVGVLNGWLETRIGLGGQGVNLKIVVGTRSPEAIEAANLRADITVRARELGVVPKTLPDWQRLEELEERLSEASAE